MKQSGVALNDIVLPPWAKGDPQEFIRMHREVGTRICRLHLRKFTACDLNCKDFTGTSHLQALKFQLNSQFRSLSGSYICTEAATFTVVLYRCLPKSEHLPRTLQC